MAFFYSPVALVNRSSTNIPVYGQFVHSCVHTGSQTAGCEKIGQIYPNEFYTLVPSSVSRYISSFQIRFRNLSGKEAIGYIETQIDYSWGDYSWAQYQEPYHYYSSTGSGLTVAKTETIDGKTHYIFTVHDSARPYMDPNGNSKGTLPVGTQLAALGSTTGQTHGGYMLFNKKKEPGVNSWQDLISGGTYGFVDLRLSVGSIPSKRPIR